MIEQEAASNQGFVALIDASAIFAGFSLAAVHFPGTTMFHRLFAPVVFFWLALAGSNSLAQTAAGGTTPTPPVPAGLAGGSSVLQLILGLALVLALMVGALWLLKQLTQRRGGASSLLKVVGATAVGPRERVVIVEIGSTWLVLGVGPGRVTPLAEVPRQPPPGEGRRATNPDFPAAARPGAGVAQ